MEIFSNSTCVINHFIKKLQVKKHTYINSIEKKKKYNYLMIHFLCSKGTSKGSSPNARYFLREFGSL